MIANSTENLQQQSVFLVHGFLSKRMLMKPLQWQIAARGYRTFNWGYTSFIGSVKDHAMRLRNDLIQFCKHELNEGRTTVHLVAHSMGSIVLRLALQEGPIANLGRIVLLAPPNQGTPTAKLLAPFVNWFCPGVAEISNGPKGIAKTIPLGSLPIGIIAARYDWVVPESRTHLPDQADHISLASTHNSLLVLPSAARRVCEFLRDGRFA